MLQDDSPLLSLKIRLLVILYAFCWADDSAFTLSMYLVMHVGSSSDWLQERIGLLMLLRWGASFLLPGWAWPLWADVAAAAAARLIAVSSRRALAAGCASSASKRQKVQAVLLLQLLQLAYWLPAARAVWTIVAALWRCASSGAPLPFGPVLRALALCTLCCERWRVHCELLAITTRMETGAVEACQPMLRASRQVEREFGCWPLHTVRSLLYTMSPQAAPHLAASCTRPPTVARMYALAGAPELATQARRQDGHTGLKYLMCPEPPFTVADTLTDVVDTLWGVLAVAASTLIMETGLLAFLPFVGFDRAMQVMGTVPCCSVLYSADGPLQHGAVSRHAGAAAAAVCRRAGAAAAAVAAPLRRSTLRVCRRALAIATWLNRHAAWRQALHAYMLGIAMLQLSTRAPFTSANALRWPELAVACAALAAAGQFGWLLQDLDVISLQAALGGMPAACYVASWFMHDDDAVMWVGMALISLVVRVGRRRCAAQGLAQLAARVLFSLAFWLAAARTTYLTAAAALAAGGLRHVPAALLLNPAVLPHTLLLALSLEPWARQAAIDSTALLDDGQAAVEALEAAAPLEGSSWWPLGVCCGLLQLTVALLSGAPVRETAGNGPYPLPFSCRIVRGLGSTTRNEPLGESIRNMVHSAETDFGSHCQALVLEAVTLFLAFCVFGGLAAWLAVQRTADTVRRAKRLLWGQAADAGAVPIDAFTWLSAAETAACMRDPQWWQQQQQQQWQQWRQQQHPSSQPGGGSAAAMSPGSGAPSSGPVIFVAGEAAGAAQRPHNRQQRQLHREQQRRQQHHQHQQAGAAEAALRQVVLSAAAVQAAAAAAAPESHQAAAAPAAAAPPEQPRKWCANCGATSGGGVKLKKCAGCRRVRHCSQECQAQHWAQHKLVCAPAE